MPEEEKVHMTQRANVGLPNITPVLLHDNVVTTADLKTLCDTSRPLTLDLLEQYHEEIIFAVYSERYAGFLRYLQSHSTPEQIDLREFYGTAFISEMEFGYFDKNQDYKYCPMTFNQVKAAYGPGVSVYADVDTYHYKLQTKTYEIYDNLGVSIDQDGQLCNNPMNGPYRIPDHATLEKLWKLVDEKMFE